MKRIITILLAMIMMAGLLAGCNSSATTGSANSGSADITPAATAPIESEYEWPTMNLVFAHWSAESVASAYMSLQFMEKITERTNGAITFDKHFGGELGAQNEMPNIISSGLADMGMISSAGNPSVTPFTYLEYTFAFSAGDAATTVHTARKLLDESEFVKAECDSLGVHELAITCMTDYALMSSKKLTCLDDLQNQKFAFVGTYFGKYLEPVGAVGISMGAGERYQNMSTGIIDGEILSLDMHITRSHYELCRYTYLCHLGAAACLRMAINKDLWDSLDPEVQQLFDEVARECEEEDIVRTDEAQAGYVQFLKDEGVTVTEISEEDLATWADLVLAMDLPSMWIDEQVSNGVTNAAEYVKEYVEAAEAVGYVWPYDVSQYKNIN